jgi:hypothetical protein
LDLWRRCCPFHEFQIDLHAEGVSVRVSGTGRPGVKEYLALDSPRLAAKMGEVANAIFGVSLPIESYNVRTRIPRVKKLTVRV